jgi:glutamate racemase
MGLGIIDWGIGGISIYKLIKKRWPDTPIIYFSDTGVTPYGKMSRNDLVDRLNTVIGFLRSKGVTHLVIGCNAASTALPFLDRQGLRIEGVIDAAVETTTKLKPARLGLIGGRRTVVSGVYRDAFRDRGIELSQRIAQPLSGLIESGDISSERLHGECRRILAPLTNCSHILLACTHYPAIEPVLGKFVSDGTKFVDPADALVKKISRWKLPTGDESDVFFTSGDPVAMKNAARAGFDCRINKVKKMVL